ncbi:hypothetical protein SAY87_029738 [Trapa incisa]|uniref:HSF-type DNA-binding domain-containing protein n=1 Tax=Trapa incisa TaxID=236973 RepID=A0AAN7Q9N6_9MYRT|nr:hypothetical protein SAY87_029738 [Trapa incisa]
MEEGTIIKLDDEGEAEAPLPPPPSGSQTRPIEGVNAAGPPPFLTKMFEMVEDPDTDPIVSWSAARNSFIVWDSHQLSAVLLPKYFNHNNFSSFIRQLNTYGIRKVDSDRWEFANEAFLGGQKHLLKNIKRRRHQNVSHLQGLTVQQQHQQGVAESCLEIGKFGLDSNIEILKRDSDLLLTEVSKLTSHQEHSRVQISALENRLRSTERKQQNMMSFLARALNNPSFLQNLMVRRGDDRGLEVRRKRRLTTSSTTNNLQILIVNKADCEAYWDLTGRGHPRTRTGGCRGDAYRVVIVRPDDLDILNDTILEELIGEDMLKDERPRPGQEEDVLLTMHGENPEFVIKDEDLVVDEDCMGWSDNFEELVDQMGYLGSSL